LTITPRDSPTAYSLYISPNSIISILLKTLKLLALVYIDALIRRGNLASHSIHSHNFQRLCRRRKTESFISDFVLLVNARHVARLSAVQTEVTSHSLSLTFSRHG